MPNTPATSSTNLRAARGAWRGYLELTKPKVVALITFTAVVGALLASGEGVPPLASLFAASAGIALAAASAATLNHVLESRIDAQMARTRTRPTPQRGAKRRCAWPSDARGGRRLGSPARIGSTELQRPRRMGCPRVGGRLVDRA